MRNLKLENFQSKSGVIRKELDEMPDSMGLFVDDDIRELTDASLVQLVNKGRLHRILFARASSHLRQVANSTPGWRRGRVRLTFQPL